MVLVILMLLFMSCASSDVFWTAFHPREHTSDPSRLCQGKSKEPSHFMTLLVSDDWG